MLPGAIGILLSSINRLLSAEIYRRQFGIEFAWQKIPNIDGLAPNFFRVIVKAVLTKNTHQQQVC